MSETPNRPASAREVFEALPHLLTAPYIPEVHGDLDEPEPMSPERLAGIAARAEAATPGPWLVADGPDGRPMVYVEAGRAIIPVAEGVRIEADAQVIAHARAWVPALLAEVERRGARIAELEAESDRLVSDRDRWRARYYEESRTYWDAELPPGGECCADCYQPVESEPCPEHHPATVAARLRAELEQLRARVEELVQQRDGLLVEDAQRELAEAPFTAGPATDAGYPPAMPWAAWLDDEDLGGFLLDLAGAAIDYYRPGTVDTETLASIEQAIATWRLIAEADHAQATAPGPDAAEVAHVVTDASDDPEHADDCPGCPDTTEAGDDRG